MKIHVLVRCVIVSSLLTLLCLLLTVKTIPMVQMPLAPSEARITAEQPQSALSESVQHPLPLTENTQHTFLHRGLVERFIDFVQSTLYPYFFAQLFPFVFVASVVSTFWNSKREQ